MHMTVFTLTYNEELFLPHFIAHYRRLFPSCKIVVYDNESTDNTVQMAIEAGCEVISYTTGNKLSDAAYLEIKNNCWKNEYGWVIVCDVDELCEVNMPQILREARTGHTILKFQGYNMVNLQDNFDIATINVGVRAESYDKMYCFNALLVKDISYGPGCHHAAPRGTVKYSEKEYICRHYKYINPDYMVQRHATYAARLSEGNLKHGYGGHYQYPEAQIRTEFEQARSQAKHL